ncbi:MAG: ABC transporter ATP-binding protein/permease [Mogibacterium sp.]|nr:ABC transporter ATP-binding protein/permease [Mogibacterium sp.]
MLQIKKICKEYRTGTLVQKALDNVSLNFRDSEFVAILGPSGSGKTTLLNVVGGLDQYDSGDLIINGVSTKKYTDRDWDSYRNHTIGFVFQSYNLIPHQTILANVELALTISGVSREERRKRAEDALCKVGLGDQLHKKPPQMSGGQMQRVAIARALVNDPDILLADEPTGALDSETSVQVMDLLKEVAADRLVIMVTHNPELAEQYATRIVRLKDGTIRSDSDPFIIDENEPPVHRNLGRASMSLLTALSLSFNNLRTKITRTLLVAFAGSIGIIGIALILSLSNGVDAYINGIEEDTLREYPLQITSTSVDMSSMITGSVSEEGEDETAKTAARSGGLTAEVYAAEEDEDAGEADRDDVAHEFRIMSTMFSMMDQNDLGSLKTFLESGESKIYDYAKAIEYKYGIEPLIYSLDGSNARQVHPDQTSQAMGIGYTGSSSLFAMASNYNVFHCLPENEQLYKDQYELKAGRWPERYDECIVVLTQYGSLTDLALYAMRFKDVRELDERTEAFRKGEEIKVEREDPLSIEYERFLGVKFKLVNAVDTYSYNSGQGVWTQKTDDKEFMANLAYNSEDLTIVGVIRPKEGVKVTSLEEDIYYTPDLLRHVAAVAGDSEIVKAQLADRETNVITGKPFGEAGDGMNMDDLFEVDTDALQNAFNFDTSAFDGLANAFSGLDMSNMDMSSMAGSDAMAAAMPSLSQEDITKLLTAAMSGYTEERAQEMYTNIFTSYMAYAAANPKTDYANLNEAFSEYLKTDGAKQILKENLTPILRRAVTEGLDDSDGAFEDFADTVIRDFGDYLSDHSSVFEGQDLSDASAVVALVKGTFSDYLSSAPSSAAVENAKSAIEEKILSKLSISDDEASAIANALADGYKAYAKNHDVPDPDAFQASFLGYMSTEEGQQLLNEEIGKSINYDALNAALAEVMGGYSANMQQMTAAMVMAMMEEMGRQVESNLSSIDLSNAFSFDADAFADALGMNMTEEELSELILALMTTDANSYDSNMNNFGYCDFNDPIEIDIYPIDFESKNEVKAILDGYNDRMKETGEDDKVIIYTDFVAALMGSVTDIIDAISYVLIAFVSISLIVSSIMIGVITYISVLERRKEIGILRAIGASKRNISEVFNAETFIIGGLAGLIGVVVSLLLLIPINAIIHSLTTANVVAAMPAAAGVALVILSVILTLIGGIIPSRKAAKSDPVTALRVE